MADSPARTKLQCNAHHSSDIACPNCWFSRTFAPTYKTKNGRRYKGWFGYLIN